MLVKAQVFCTESGNIKEITGRVAPDCNEDSIMIVDRFDSGILLQASLAVKGLQGLSNARQISLSEYINNFFKTEAVIVVEDKNENTKNNE